jgi:formate dehydrogenase major subunit
VLPWKSQDEPSLRLLDRRRGRHVFGFSLAPVYAQTQGLKIARTTETRSTCPYCSVSCGVIIHTLGDKAKNAIPQVVHVEGDPDHPINRGTLCPKGASLEQDIVNERRLLKPQVRRPGATDHWDDISWDDAINEIARWTKKTRDATFIDKDKTATPLIVWKRLVGLAAALIPMN